jgi:lipoprotein signal peptidase
MAPPPAGSKTDTSNRPDVPAIRHLPSQVRFWGTGIVVLILDLWSKHWAFTALPPNGSRPLINHVIDLHRSLNDGAVFGSFTGQVGLFMIASLFALVFVFYLFFHSSARHYITHLALALILAGALGNLCDRAFIKADVFRYQTEDGRQASLIGRIVGENEDSYDVAEWPDGQTVQTILKSEAEVRHQGVVRDFIKFVPKFPSWVPRFAGRDIWPWVFNIADAALVCGVAVLFVGSWVDRKPRGST